MDESARAGSAPASCTCASALERDPRAQHRPTAGRALDLERPVEGADPVAQAAQAAAAGGLRPPTPSSRTSTVSPPSSAAMITVASRA